ncbi:T9SS type A sorting domain-containing protein [Paraflavitalea sp. CAU 1676]|uniref:T9SS type A sorting domain-containing protein n=1 Tax=Paraflavitalea sp. CAU 1676 TaxID=3032598 RepID=UPI0023DC0A8F|nr:T9SS type A sorting domain-containing protein [Paraflavitalea sp. CAU 1676]MDF2193317.1 T9SS type A sorting domain-containing protein [Paraflavitalea sp. CAU 1676]
MHCKTIAFLCRLLAVMYLLTASYTITYAQAPLVSMQNGKLAYNQYANEGQQNAVNTVPDFSNAGYKGGGVTLPTLAVVKTVTAPASGDTRALIQAAIDEVSALAPDANGYRGAVLLKAGIYPIEGTVFIRTGGVVLRGEGTGLQGTVLIATKKEQHTLITLQGAGSGYAEVAGSRVKITTPYLATGAKTLEVSAGHSIQVGNNIVVQRMPNEAWIDTLDMRQYGWTASGYRNTYERKVVAVQGNSITLDIPIVDPLEDAYGGGDVFKANITGRIQQSGVENLRMESFFASNDDESHGWNAVQLNRAENCWVRDVVAKYFGYAAVNISNMSRYNTVQDCAMIDPKSVTTGGRKYSFNLEGNATLNLFQRCMTWGGRHDFVTGSRVPGPNVFLDCMADNTQSDIGPHHRWSAGLLFDNIYGGQIHVQNRKASGSGHGWAGAQTMFWNCYAYKGDIEVESPKTAKNWGIGCIGPKQTSGGYWESWGTHVLPRSLYLQQLEDRLGAQAVQNIITPQQVQGRIWDSLKANAARIAQEPKVPVGTSGPSASFDITDNGGTITGQYPNTTKPSEDVPSLIDNATNTKYFRSGRTNLWVQYQSTVPAIITRYTISSANDVPERDPKNWKLSASNDGVNWLVLDSQVNQTFASRLLTKTYKIDTNVTAFSYYRLTITANNGQTGTQFSEWELFERRIQHISMGDIPDQTFGDDPFEVVTSSNAGLPVTVEVLSGPGILADSFVTITGAGAILLRASQPGNDQYFPASIEKQVIVNKALQTVHINEVAAKIFGDAPFELSATASTGLPLVLEVTGPATLAANTVSIKGAGTIRVTATQPGNDNYEAATAEQSIIVNKATQTISFGALAPRLKNETVNLVATATSELPVAFKLMSGAGTLTGNSLKLNDEGLVTVQAEQAGNENYEAAAPVQQTILVLGLDYLKPGVGVLVYPNPTTGPLKVKVVRKPERSYSFLLIDRNGVVVASANLPAGSSTNEVNFKLAGKINGLYFLHVTDGYEKSVRIIVKY